MGEDRHDRNVTVDGRRLLVHPNVSDGVSIEIRCISECLEVVPTIALWHYDEWGHHDPEGSLESWTEGLAERVHEGRIPTTFVAFEGSTPVGSAVLVEHDMETRRDLTPWLAGVFVVPSARERGIATALVGHAMDAARGFGIETLYLYTNGAEPLYAVLGWSSISEEFYEGRNVTLMSVSLSRSKLHRKSPIPSRSKQRKEAANVKDFSGRIAVITGAGTGMGRELARQLAAEGCHVAFCDVSKENMAETQRLCEAEAPVGTRVSAHLCDVSLESQVLAFRDAVLEQHETETVNLLFNNAGIGGAGSFLTDDREEWDKVFGVCWSGVYYCARAFLPLIVASDAGCIVNTSSVNGFWASLGPGTAHTAYSSAKFAVKGFSEALLNDLRIYAPHVQVALVMPGHVGTSITTNSRKVLGKAMPKDMDAKELAQVRANLKRQGLPVDDISDAQLRAGIEQRMTDFRDKAPVTAGQAATIILDGVREGRWRILVGDDAKRLDERVRAQPEAAYEPAFVAQRGTSQESDQDARRKR